MKEKDGFYNPANIVQFLLIQQAIRSIIQNFGFTSAPTPKEPYYIEIAPPANLITLRDPDEDNSIRRILPDFDTDEQLEIKRDMELSLFMANIRPEELIHTPATQFYRHTIQVTPQLEARDAIHDMVINYYITANDEHGNEITVEYEIITENIRGTDRQFILIQPFNHAYGLLDHQIRIDLLDVYDPGSQTFHQATYEFFIQQRNDDEAPHLVRNLLHTARIEIDGFEEDSSADASEDDLPTGNPFAALDFGDSDSDTEEEEGADIGAAKKALLTSKYTMGNSSYDGDCPESPL